MEPLLRAQRGDAEDAYDCEPALTLLHAVKRGLDYPRRTVSSI
jgi:hypothetical protein